jgi:hypothetical protein
MTNQTLGLSCECCKDHDAHADNIQERRLKSFKHCQAHPHHLPVRKQTETRNDGIATKANTNDLSVVNCIVESVGDLSVTLKFPILSMMQMQIPPIMPQLHRSGNLRRYTTRTQAVGL